MTITDRYIDGLVAQSQQLTIQVKFQVRMVLLDYLGVLVGGRKYLIEKHPELIVSAPSEVFLDGFAAHVLELDDGHRHGMIHLGASIISAVLDAAKKENLKSDDVLRGIVMGYEAAVRCARAIQPGHKERGYHVSGTCGTIGSAMGIAFASGYSKEQLKSTLACAVSSAAGVLEIQEQASELKPYNVGRAAMAGVVAAQVGKLGLPGPDDILGGKRGFLAALTGTPKPEFLTDFSNDDYTLMGIYQKVHAACRHAHPAIEAALALRDEVAIDEIEHIKVQAYKLAVAGHDHKTVSSISSAKMSIPFSVTVALIKGDAGLQAFTEETILDRKILDLAKKVDVVEDELLTAQSPAKRASIVVIQTSKGTYTKQVDYPKGEPENPLSKEELEEKFRGLAMYGGLTTEECEVVIEEIWKDEFSIEKIMKIVCK